MNFGVIKAAVMTGLNIANKVPLGGIVKIGIMAGVTVFTAWVLIKRAKKMHAAANVDETTTEAASPVDEILHGKDYVNNVDDYDDMDPAARELCRKLNKMRKSKKAKRKAAKKRAESNERVVSLFGDSFGKDVEDEDGKPEKKGGTSKRRPFYKSAADMYYNEFGAGKKKRKKKRNSDDLKRAIRDIARSMDPTNDEGPVANLFKGVADEVNEFIRTGGAETEEERLRDANPSLF